MKCQTSQLHNNGVRATSESGVFLRFTLNSHPKTYAQLTVAPPPVPSLRSRLQYRPRTLSYLRPRPNRQAFTSAQPSDAPPSPLANAFKVRSPLSALRGAFRWCTIIYIYTRGHGHDTHLEGTRRGGKMFPQVQCKRRNRLRSAKSTQISPGWVKGWVTVTNEARRSVSPWNNSDADDVEPNDNGMLT